jgi:hypothetical protein
VQQDVRRRGHGVRRLDRVDVGRGVPGYVRRNTVELIKAVRRRKALGGDTQVPLTSKLRATGPPDVSGHNARGRERAAPTI